MAGPFQKDIFRESEGNAFHRRNVLRPVSEELEDISKHDPIIKALEALKIRPVNLLEIGSGAGFRLECIRTLFNSRCHGIEPSSEAITFARESFPHISFYEGIASELPFSEGQLDTIIFGFCLCYCDRQDLFKIAYEADRVLSDPGFLIIMDFCAPVCYRNIYKHRAGIFVHKMDYASMFLWNPSYTRLYDHKFTHDSEVPAQSSGFDDHVAVSVLHRNSKQAWPLNPYGQFGE